MKVVTKSSEETQQVAKSLANYLSSGDVICLHGDLGAGKTTFAQGLAVGLGVSEVVNSPTFTIVSEYQGRLPFYHMDVYRLGEQAAQEPMGYEDYFYGRGVTVVEWSEFIQDLLPDDVLHITIRLEEHGSRKIQLEPVGEHFNSILKEWNEHGISRA